MRKKKNYKRDFQPDLAYNSVAMTRFVNYLMRKGEKSVAERVMYRTMNLVKQKTNEEPLAVFDKAIANASPVLEVVSRRVGGANYQAPREVRGDRKFMLACRWILLAARSKKGRPMAEKLAEEIIAASKNEGVAIKKKLDTHRMAEANRAFAHFAW